MSEWTTEFPTEEGLYWFYGYRYGKISCGSTNEPELSKVDVHVVKNGFMYIADGQFMYEGDVEQPHFQKITPPELPELT